MTTLQRTGPSVATGGLRGVNLLNRPILNKGEAQAHFDWLAPSVAMDNPTSDALTRSSLGWRPQEPALLTDMRDGGYFGTVP